MLGFSSPLPALGRLLVSDLLLILAAAFDGDPSSPVQILARTLGKAGIARGNPCNSCLTQGPSQDLHRGRWVAIERRSQY